MLQTTSTFDEDRVNDERDNEVSVTLSTWFDIVVKI